jgi:hypothetical protein
LCDWEGGREEGGRGGREEGEGAANVQLERNLHAEGTVVGGFAKAVDRFSVPSYNGHGHSQL